MQYIGMPYSWVDFYYQGFQAINVKYQCNVSEDVIAKSQEILREFNPRVNYREEEYSPEHIFSKALKDWKLNVPVQSCVDTFWEGLHLKAEIYSDTISVLKCLKEKGYKIATLTDLPSAMPDELFKKDIHSLLEYFDYYVSSGSCGYRKPNCNGLRFIANQFEVEMSEICFVGDEEKDRMTADNAGCKFVQIKRGRTEEGCISNLYQLLEVL